MNTAALPFRRVFITGALVSALSLSALAAVSAQEATEAPAAPETTETQAERGFLGVQVADSEAGVVVLAVLSGSPGEAAGLAEGDIITAVNGEAVDSAQAVADAIGALAAGDAVTLDVTRAGEALTLDATLGLASDLQAQMPGAGTTFSLPSQRDVVLRFGADDQAWGVVGLAEDAPLYAAGLRSGDLITGIDGSMYDPLELLAYVAGLGTDANLKLEVVRDGATVEVTVPAADFVAAGVMGRGMMQMFGGANQGMMPFGQMLPGREGMLNMMPGYGNRAMNGWLGVSFVTLDEAVAAARNVALTDGALIVEVEADSPAALAGVQADDVVTAVNGEPVDAERTLRDRLVAYEAGDTITLTVNRGGVTQDIQVTLGQPVALQMGQMFGMPGIGQGNAHGWGQGGNGGHGYGQPNQPPAQPEATPETTGANA
ncbi:MAG: PDZ domain-containing protein [Anaerolineae bacterium]|nr:PDZ domain-containing protein [Anaerolineae bacterium]